jgi:hypothetical protein
VTHKTILKVRHRIFNSIWYSTGVPISCLPTRHLIRNLPSISTAFSTRQPCHSTPTNPQADLLHCLTPKHNTLSKTSRMFNDHKHRVPHSYRSHSADAKHLTSCHPLASIHARLPPPPPPHHSPPSLLSQSLQTPPPHCDQDPLPRLVSITNTILLPRSPGSSPLDRFRVLRCFWIRLSLPFTN